jgi:hypothetical protein
MNTKPMHKFSLVVLVEEQTFEKDIKAIEDNHEVDEYTSSTTDNPKKEVKQKNRDLSRAGQSYFKK